MPHAHAPKPPPSSSSLQLVMVTDLDGSGSPNFGDTVTFAVQTTQTVQPYVDLQAFQNGALVYHATAGFWPTYAFLWTQYMKLSSGSWTSGPADCVATLYYYSGRKAPVLATLSFKAGA